MGEVVEVERLRQKAQRLLATQRAQVRALLGLRELLGGSLVVRYAVCGKEGCVCRTGRKHGPYYVLSTRSAGRGGFSYLDEQQMAEARALVRAYREYRAGMRRLGRVGEQLVVLLRRYQEATTREGTRRVGLPPQAQA